MTLETELAVYCRVANAPPAFYQMDWLIAINSLQLKTLMVQLIFRLILLRLAR